MAAKSSKKWSINAEYYQHLVDSLYQLERLTRPGIAFSVSELPKFKSNSTTTHLKAALLVLRYLKGSRSMYLVYKRQERTVSAILTRIGDQMSAIEDHLRAIYSPFRAGLSLGHLHDRTLYK